MNRAGTGRQAELLRDDILRTRADLGQTVRALAERADLRSRARTSAARYRERTRASTRRLTQRTRASSGRFATRTQEALGRPDPWQVIGAGALGAAAALLVARIRPVRRWVRSAPPRSTRRAYCKDPR